jgi:hypothetical protein
MRGSGIGGNCRQAAINQRQAAAAALCNPGCGRLSRIGETGGVEDRAQMKGWITPAMLLLGVVAASSARIDGAIARERAYVGTWAAKRAQCKLAQDRQDAPMLLRSNGYDQHETHCRFVSVKAGGEGVWRVRARCSVEGDSQQHDLTLQVGGGRLTVADKRGSRLLRRCN